MKNEEVIRNFINDNEAKTQNLFCETTNKKFVLYSYGYHFPLCVKLNDGTLLFNGSGYSQTTARHKGDMARGFGFGNFKDLTENKKDIIVLNTDELNKIIKDSDINSLTDYLQMNL